MSKLFLVTSCLIFVILTLTMRLILNHQKAENEIFKSVCKVVNKEVIPSTCLETKVIYYGFGESMEIDVEVPCFKVVIELRNGKTDNKYVYGTYYMENTASRVLDRLNEYEPCFVAIHRDVLRLKYGEIYSYPNIDWIDGLLFSIPLILFFLI